jgi:serine/threonine protein phosphatase PrpC
MLTMRFAAAAASFREKTEDRTLVLRVGDHCIIAVADGSGGMTGGGTAAEMFVAGIKRASDSRDIDFDDPSAWVALLKMLDEEIERLPLAGETTGIALAVTPRSVVGASAGDSRAWLFAENSYELTRNQTRKPRFGTGRAEPRPFTGPARGTLVVGTDGLFDYAAVDDIRAMTRVASQHTADALVELPRARTRALPDDVAVVVAWLDQPEIEREPG